MKPEGFFEHAKRCGRCAVMFAAVLILANLILRHAARGKR